MAQGSVTTFEEFRRTIGDGTHNLSTDTLAFMLIVQGVGTITAAGDGTDGDDSLDYTEVSGTNYTAGGIVISKTWTEVAGTGTLALTAPVVWTAAVGGPSNIRTALLYNQTHAGTSDAIGFVDLTVDNGVTAINLADGDVTINAGNIFTLV